jgi:hypothetical protein
VEVSTDFECGGGKRLARLGDSHWRVEASGDASGYDKYFCVRVTADADGPPAVLRLEVHPDADLGEAGARFFLAQFPSDIWYCAEDWASWRPVGRTWEGAVAFRDRSIDLRVPVAPGARWHVATNPVLRYSDLLAWIDRTRAGHGGRLESTSLGRSAEGREVPLLRLRGARPGRPKLLVLAGQHPSEHCGTWACEGLVEHLLSPIAEAREIADAFDLAVVPMINPDGNVRGLSGANAEGINLFSDFAGVADAGRPGATEHRLLWRWLCAEFPPDAILHFHGQMGWSPNRFLEHPYDGIYLLTHAEQLYAQPERLAAYRAIQARLRFETPAYTGSWREGALGEATIEHQLAVRFGTLSAFYEINSGSVGAFAQYRRGPQVLGAVARALMHDAGVDR